MIDALSFSVALSFNMIFADTVLSVKKVIVFACPVDAALPMTFFKNQKILIIVFSSM